MGSTFSRASKSGRSLARAAPAAGEHAMRVRLSEKALKPEPRGAEELRELSEAERKRVQELGAPVKSEYSVEYEEQDASLDSMLNDLGGSLTRHRVNLYDQKELAENWARHRERQVQADGRIEPKLLVEAYHQYYKEREAKGEEAVTADIAAKYRLDQSALEKLFGSTCLPTVRNEAAGGSEKGGANVQMQAEWR